MTLTDVVNKYPHLFPDRLHLAIGEGWADLLAELCEYLKDKPVTFSQVKEKFGSLRVYLHGEPSLADLAAVHAIETRSAKICEECGKPGKTRGPGWLRTLCDACAEKRTGLR